MRRRSMFGDGPVTAFHGPSTYDSIAAAATAAHNVRNAQDLGLIPRGVHRGQQGGGNNKAQYYAKLLAEGHTKDPYTGHDIPGVNAIAGAISQAADALIPDDRGPQTVTNEFVGGPLTAAQQQENARGTPMPRQQPPDRFAASSAALEDMLLGASQQPTTRDIVQSGLMTPDEGQRHFGEAFDQLTKAQAFKAARDKIAMSTAMNAPGVMRKDVERMQAEYAAKYPAFAGDLPEPMSPRQQQEQERMLRLQEYRDSYESLGIPGHVVTGIDEKGQPLGPSPTEYWAAETNRNKMQFEQVREERAYYKDVLSELQKNEPEPPETKLLQPGAAQAAETQFATQHRLWETRVNAARTRAFGFNPDADAAVSAPERAAPAGERGGAPRSGTIEVQTAESPERMAAALADGSWAAGTPVSFGGKSYTVVQTNNGLKLQPAR